MWAFGSIVSGLSWVVFNVPKGIFWVLSQPLHAFEWMMGEMFGIIGNVGKGVAKMGVLTTAEIAIVLGAIFLIWKYYAGPMMMKQKKGLSAKLF